MNVDFACHVYLLSKVIFPLGSATFKQFCFFVSEFLIVICREIGYSSKFFHHKYRLGCKTIPTNYTITHFFGTQHFKPSSLPSALDDLKFTLAEKKKSTHFLKNMYMSWLLFT